MQIQTDARLDKGRLPRQSGSALGVLEQKVCNIDGNPERPLRNSAVSFLTNENAEILSEIRLGVHFWFADGTDAVRIDDGGDVRPQVSLKTGHRNARCCTFHSGFAGTNALGKFKKRLGEACSLNKIGKSIWEERS